MKLAKSIISLCEDTDDLKSEFQQAAESEDYSKQLGFLKKAYAFFNKKKFKGELQEPTIEFKKSVSLSSLKSVGLWYEKIKTLKIDQRLFYAGWEAFREVLLHEMCHQFIGGTDKTSHGPLWKAKMKEIGVPASTKIQLNFGTLYAPSEIRKINALKAMMDSTEKLTNPKIGDYAKMLDKKGWVLGLYAGNFFTEAVIITAGEKYVKAPRTSIYVPTKEEIKLIDKMNIEMKEVSRG